ncbi:MAG: carbohydrate kinase family protein [Chitinivibrionales bacterium]|nr:carbohydrate kinase family protein [Chitinivibrionales bacterium]
MPDNSIVVAGHLCLDITPAFHRTDASGFGELLVPGALLNVGPCTVSTGGPVSNTGIALVKLNCDTVMMAKVGNDPFGRSVVEKMRELGADGGIIVVDGEHTSYTVALAPPGLDRVFLHHPGANDTFGADDIPYEKLDDAGLFHLGYPPLMRRMFLDDGKELAETLRRARERGVTVSLDMSLPDPSSESGAVDWDTVLQRVLPYVDIFLPSAEEVLFALERDRFMRRRERSAREGIDALELFTPDDYSRLSERLLSYGVAVAGLKSGHRGIYVRTASAERLRSCGRVQLGDIDAWADRELWEPPFVVESVASATGAGDSAIAGFLAAVVKGASLQDALRVAAAVGAQNVTALDATSGIGSWEQTLEMVQSRPKAVVDIDASGWRFDHSGQRWHGPGDSRR